MNELDIKQIINDLGIESNILKEILHHFMLHMNPKGVVLHKDVKDKLCNLLLISEAALRACESQLVKYQILRKIRYGEFRVMV